MEKRIIENSHDLNAALIGMILFDGSMSNSNNLYLRHGGKQLSYVDEKVEYLKSYLCPKSLRTCVDKKGFVYRYAYYRNESLRFLHQDIYINGKKTLTDALLNRFNEITLAFMYMDDGSLVLHKDKKRPGQYKGREIYLATHSFSKHEVEKLRNHLFNKWDVNFRVSPERGHYRLCCNGSNAIKFCTIVAPVMQCFPTLQYKLDFKYVKKQLPF